MKVKSLNTNEMNTYAAEYRLNLVPDFLPDEEQHLAAEAVNGKGWKAELNKQKPVSRGWPTQYQSRA